MCLHGVNNVQWSSCAHSSPEAGHAVTEEHHPWAMGRCGYSHKGMTVAPRLIYYKHTCAYKGHVLHRMYGYMYAHVQLSVQVSVCMCECIQCR